jgi:hypothetical protein
LLVLTVLFFSPFALNMSAVDAAPPGPAATRECTKCKEARPSQDFQYGCTKCTTCRSALRKERDRTQSGFFGKLIRSSQGSSGQYKKDGQGESVVYTIDAAYLEKRWTLQGGMCYYTGLELQIDPDEENYCSLARIDRTRGFIRGNIVLVIQELNGATPWSIAKLDQMEELRQTAVDMAQLETLVADAKRPPTRAKKPPFVQAARKKDVGGGIVHYLCRSCKEHKAPNEFALESKDHIGSDCNDCLKKVQKQPPTLRRFMQTLSSNAHARSKASGESTEQETTAMNKEQQEAVGDRQQPETAAEKQEAAVDLQLSGIQPTITRDQLFDKITGQRGRCFYSDIPLSFVSGTPWQASLGRLDGTKPYSKSNVVLVCSEFCCRRPWSRARFEEIFAGVQTRKQQRATGNDPLSPPEEEEPPPTPPPETTRACTVCKETKPLADFEYGRFKCQPCRNAYRKSLDLLPAGFFSKLARAAERSAEKRKSVGREDAGVCTIDASDLEELWNKQGGLCHYTGLVLGFDAEKPNFCSLERLNPMLGYVKGNIALIIHELNGKITWSIAKLEQMSDLRRSHVDLVELGKLVHEAQHFERAPKRKGFKVNREREKEIEGVKHYACGKCKSYKIRTDFYSRSDKVTSKCKACEQQEDRERPMTLRRYVQVMIGNSRGNTKTRAERTKQQEAAAAGEAHAGEEPTLTQDQVYAKILAQGGRCHYSGIPLCFTDNTAWQCSLERLDATKTYTDENVVLVCLELNCNKQWSVARFNEILACVEACKQKRAIAAAAQPIVPIVATQTPELAAANPNDLPIAPRAAPIIIDMEADLVKQQLAMLA